MNHKIAMIVGKNFEEIELVTTIDILRRAKINVEIISLFNEPILTGAHQIKVASDKNFSDFKESDYTGLLIPGGAGVDQLDDPLIDQEALIKLVQDFNQNSKLVGAICAAPQILGKAGILDQVKITHFPDSTKFLDKSDVDLTQPSIIDQKIITARSAGTAIDFALNVVEYLTDIATRKAVEEQLVIKY